MKFMENLISGMLPFSLLIFCGVYITVTGRFFQFTKFFDSLKLVIKAFRSKKQTGKGISSFQSACTAISATVGTGNIAGVAGAISLGGAGAIFWMWVSAFLGMAIKFAEVKFAVFYRERQGTEFIGGPMFYIKNGLHKSFGIFGIIFVLAAIPAVFFSGNITQVNAAVLSIGTSAGTRFVFGIVFAFLTALVIGGGAKRIGTVTEKIVPIMSILYILLSLGIIIANFSFLPKAFLMIFEGAFNPKAVTGGVIGSVTTAMMTGASRGVFSNEAGLGTSAMAHSVAVDAKADTQGLFGIFEVFIDSGLICTLTALTILCSSVNIEYGSFASSELVSKALSLFYGFAAKHLLSIMMSFFAFSSVIGWAFYGDICSKFIFGDKGKKLFAILYPPTCIIGALCNAEIPWRLSAVFNGIMLCINLPAIMLLWSKKDKRGKEIDIRKN